MGNHHDHHNDHSTEKKPVSFTVPLIFASVIVLVIVLLVNLGDSRNECCEGDNAQACVKDAHGKCESKGEEKAHGDAHHEEAKESNHGETALDSTVTHAPEAEGHSH